MKPFVLLTPDTGAELDRLLALTPGAEVTVARDLASLEAALRAGPGLLVAFGTGVVVPPALLELAVDGAWNFHAAPPQYPGRDPHHFAVYDGVTRYGVMAHRMAERVDEGDVVAVEYFPVEGAVSPRELLVRANEAMLRLYARLVPDLLEGRSPAPLEGEQWSGVKTRRRDFLEMCTLSPVIGQAEFERRVRAFDDPDHDNLHVMLHGRSFRLDRAAMARAPADARWSDFTEAAYRRVLRTARERGYAFEAFGTGHDGPHVLWRHDIDLSVHRAAALARIEVEEGVRSSWLVNPHCAFYNVLEPGTSQLLRDMAAAGHALGLHFDAAAYDEQALRDRATLHAALAREKTLLEDALDVSVDMVSWHDPEAAGLLDVQDDVLAGMVNCYSSRLREDYEYVSDSNGYWRFQSLEDALAAGSPRLHVLTHPGWWTPEPMSPRARVDRCLLGRARAVGEGYDAELAADGRANIGGRLR